MKGLRVLEFWAELIRHPKARLTQCSKLARFVVIHLPRCMIWPLEGSNNTISNHDHADVGSDGKGDDGYGDEPNQHS